MFFRKVPGKVFPIRVFGRKPSNRYPGRCPQDSRPLGVDGSPQRVGNGAEERGFTEREGDGDGRIGFRGFKPGERFFLVGW